MKADTKGETTKLAQLRKKRTNPWTWEKKRPYLNGLWPANCLPCSRLVFLRRVKLKSY